MPRTHRTNHHSHNKKNQNTQQKQKKWDTEKDERKAERETRGFERWQAAKRAYRRWLMSSQSRADDDLHTIVQEEFARVKLLTGHEMFKKALK